MRLAYVNESVFYSISTRKAGEKIQMALVKSDSISPKKDYEIMAFVMYPDGTHAIEVIDESGDMVLLKKEPK